MSSIRMYTDSLTSDFTIYNYGEVLSYEINRLSESRSQCGTFYPQPYGNSSIANIKKTLSFTIEYIDNDERELLMDFFSHVEGGKSFALVVTNDKEEVYNISSAKFDDSIKFNQPDIDYWNADLKIREI
jgi:hypothetical protein